MGRSTLAKRNRVAKGTRRAKRTLRAKRTNVSKKMQRLKRSFSKAKKSLKSKRTRRTNKRRNKNRRSKRNRLMRGGLSLRKFNKNYGLQIEYDKLPTDEKELVDVILGGDDELLIDTLQQYFNSTSESMKNWMMNYMYSEMEEGLVGPVLEDL